jgi:Ca2+/Na+ antiporter
MMMGNLSKTKFYGGIFFLIILVFAVVYTLLPSTINGVDHFGNALYFSIVTITTLGFGDVTPAKGWGQLLVSLEAIAGVISIGLFLNAISESQAQKVDANEKERTKQERKDIAHSKLRQYYLMLKNVMERYLTEAYAVTTPLDKRKFPEDIMHYHFQFTFNDISDLYKTSLLLYDPPYQPVIATFFEVQDKLYSEFRSLVSDIDISYWKDLESLIHQFLKICNDFLFKGSILSCAQTTLNNHDAEMMSKLIKEHEGELIMLPSNAINQYISLFSLLTINISLIQQIAGEMEEALRNN